MSLGGPKKSNEAKQLEQQAIAREKELKIERAKQRSAAFSDNIAFRKKLRGVFSLLTGDFKGFPTNLGATQNLGSVKPVASSPPAAIQK